MRIITDLFAWAQTEVPEWNTISISGYHIREAGSTAVQEVAFTFANAIAYIESAIAAGLDVDSFAPRLSFFFNAHSDFLTEIAKFRAARRLYARLMRDRFRREERPLLHAAVPYANRRIQPDGPAARRECRAHHARSACRRCWAARNRCTPTRRDEALGLPTEESAQLALRTQQVIAYETGVTSVPDPFGGSYYIEELTDRIEREAMDYIRRIDEMGGTLRAIEAGFIQGEIQNSAFEFQREIEKGERIIVGVNRFQTEERDRVPVFRIDPANERVADRKPAEDAGVREMRSGGGRASPIWKPPRAEPRT